MGGLTLVAYRRAAPTPISGPLLRAAGVGPAVAARVTRARPDHAAAAPRALDRVLPRVEEGGLARRGDLGRRRSDAVCVAPVRVALGHPRLDLGREDPGLLLLVGGEELLAH